MTAGRPFPGRLPHWLIEGPLPSILRSLSSDGHEARVVGGAVRNALIGLPPGDIDIATTRTPDEVMAIGALSGWTVVPTGVAFGTVTVVVERRGFEVTTLREDIETDGRHAVVRFGRDWEADAARRDFTVNAMSLDAEGHLADFFGGATDLAARRIRFIGEPHRRIAEDCLRILRFFRFHASYGQGDPDSVGLAACIALQGGMDLLSAERVQAELFKLVVAPGAVPALEALGHAGIGTRLLGGVITPAAISRIAALEGAGALDPDAVIRLGAAAVQVREDAERLRVKLRLSNEAFRRLDGAAHGWPSVEDARDEAAARRALFLSGPRGFRDRVMLAFARRGDVSDLDLRRRQLALPDRWRVPTFPVSGETLQARGLVPGPTLGEALARIRRAWLAAGLPTDPMQVEAIVSTVLDG